MKQMKDELYAELPFLSYAPIEFISALTGQRTTNILEISQIEFMMNILREFQLTFKYCLEGCNNYEYASNKKGQSS